MYYTITNNSYRGKLQDSLKKLAVQPINPYQTSFIYLACTINHANHVTVLFEAAVA